MENTREEGYDSKFKLWNVSYCLYNQDSLGRNKTKNNQKNILLLSVRKNEKIKFKQRVPIGLMNTATLANQE